MLKTPKEILPHSTDYKDSSWRNYSIPELADFVHLLVKRANHRASKEKALKDIYDARNYLAMIKPHIDEMEDFINQSSY